MLRPTILILSCLIVAQVYAQESSQPQVRVNVVNVCTPSDPDKAEIATALERIPAKAVFGSDYETARGRTTEKAGAADWIRMRREFAGDSGFTNVQYQISMAGGGVQEMMVFHRRESRTGEPLQISFEQIVSAGTAAQVVASDTAPGRISIGRFGKPSLVLARCPNVDQKAYEPLFRTAAERFAAYRRAMGVRATVTAELARMGARQTKATKRADQAK